MSILLERIDLLCEKHGINRYILSKELEMSSGTMNGWGKKSPNLASIQPVANYFNVSMDYLTGRSDVATTPDGEELLSDKEFALYKEISTLTETNKEVVLSAAKRMNELQHKEGDKKK